MIGYIDESGPYVIVAIGSDWFVIESIVVSQKLRQVLQEAESVIWPLSNPNAFKDLEIKLKEADPKVTLETRLDKE